MDTEIYLHISEMKKCRRKLHFRVDTTNAEVRVTLVIVLNILDEFLS